MDRPPDPPPPTLQTSPRTRLRRHPERARTERAALDEILDQGWVVHVGIIDDGQPFVIPTTYVRLDDSLYLHGAVGNRMLRAATAGADLCATVTLLDGLVLARSAFNHSMNYRSAMVLGRAHAVEDPADKARVLAALVDRLVPGRSVDARAPSSKELALTTVLALSLEEASVKVRTGPPLDTDADLAWPAWAGVIPLRVSSGVPLPEAGTAGAEPARTLAGPTEAVPAPAPTTVAEHAGYLLSDDRERIDFGLVTAWLADAYWCPGIPRWAVERSARCSSLVAGAYTAGEQIGYLRVVSDCTRFANVMDVFVAPGHRGRGVGRALVRFALAHPAHRDVPRWLLGTKDAHGVYAHEGFRPLAEPDRLMQRVADAPWERR